MITDYLFNLRGEGLLKIYLTERESPLNVSVIKTEYQIPNTKKRVDILARDDKGMVVIEIKANPYAGIDALNQAIEYKACIKTIFNKPTRIIILSNKFTPELAKHQSAELSLYSIKEHRKTGIKNYSYYDFEFTDPIIKPYPEIINIPSSRPYIFPDPWFRPRTYYQLTF